MIHYGAEDMKGTRDNRHAHAHVWRSGATGFEKLPEVY